MTDKVLIQFIASIGIFSFYITSLTCFICFCLKQRIEEVIEETANIDATDDENNINENDEAIIQSVNATIMSPNDTNLTVIDILSLESDFNENIERISDEPIEIDAIFT